MKNRKTRTLALVLAVVMAFGLAAPAWAYSTPDFSDVPSDHWAYEAVMKMADAAVIKGTGNGAFSPEMKLSAEMFIVLVGRVVFPEVKTEGADWSGPYVSEAKSKGLLEGTNVTDDNLKGEISRYDMAVVLAKAVELLKVNATKADSSKVTDYGDIPNRYTNAVLMAYGSGLIRGNQSGSFNGANSMTRQEAATVMDRLLGLIPQGEVTDPQPTTDPENPDKPDEPKSEKVQAAMRGQFVWYKPSLWKERTQRSLVDQVFPYELRYTEDGGKTYQVITASKTTFNNPERPGSFVGYLDRTPFDVERSLFENKDGQFYISAEVNVEAADGAHLVTWDRRAVRSDIYPVQFGYNEDGDYYYVEQVEVPLVPPSSNTVTVVFEGRCEAYVRAEGEERSHEASPSDITVKLAYCPDGHPGWNGYRNGGRYVKILGEAVSDSEGNFHMETEVDELDYHPDKELYTVYAEGEKEGEHCASNPDFIVSLEEIWSGYERAPITVRNYTP